MFLETVIFPVFFQEILSSDFLHRFFPVSSCSWKRWCFPGVFSHKNATEQPFCCFVMTPSHKKCSRVGHVFFNENCHRSKPQKCEDLQIGHGFLMTMCQESKVLQPKTLFHFLVKINFLYFFLRNSDDFFFNALSFFVMFLDSFSPSF